MAVYTDIGEPDLVALLAAYDLGTLRSFHGIAEGVENSNFALDTTEGRFILTIYEKRVDPADLPFFLGLMRHLAGKGVPCPLPVAGRDGEVLRQLKGKPAALVSFLDGVWPRRWNAERCHALGKALAELHLAGADFTIRRPNALSLEGWARLRDGCRGKADRVEAGLDAEIESELAAMNASWPKDLPAGVIHADLFPDNVFFEGDRVTGVIDFYFACNDLLAYDLAICLNAWCFEVDGSFNITKGRALLDGYQGLRRLEPAELKALPLLARGSALRFMLTRLYDWLHQVEGALVKPKDPREYLTKLRFHRGVRGPEAYGLA
ncbi:MAG: homoserine kinase [Geminicoccaceae bacterium]